MGCSRPSKNYLSLDLSPNLERISAFTSESLTICQLGQFDKIYNITCFVSSVGGNSISSLWDEDSLTEMASTFTSWPLETTEELFSLNTMFPREGVRPDSVSFHVDSEDTLNLMRLLSTTMNVFAYIPVRVERAH